jgi:hypothetical protein
MPILWRISFIVAVVVWVAVLLDVVTGGFDRSRVWFQVFFLVFPAVLAWWSWQQIRAPRRDDA